MAKSKRDRALARARARASAREEKARARLRDTGPDQGGNYSVNPYAARGHIVEVAPKELRSNPNSTQHPKRIATQRMIDRYKAHGHITPAEWLAADSLWQSFCEAGLLPRVSSAYDPDMQHARHSNDGVVAQRIEGAQTMEAIFAAIPSRYRGVVRSVVIEDIPASEWSMSTGKGMRKAKEHGLASLRAGLQRLMVHFGY